VHHDRAAISRGIFKLIKNSNKSFVAEHFGNLVTS
jgi:hypothetical protein